MSDELAEIDGLKPKVVMVDGDEKEVSSLTSKSVYKVKRTWDHYYCTCPAWRNQSGHPVNARTCKHLKSLLGDAYEAARIKLRNPDGAEAPAAGKKTATKKAPAKKAPAAAKKAPAEKAPAAKGKGKRKKDEDDDEEDEEDEEEEEEEGVKPAKKKARKTSARRAKKDEDEDEDEDDDDDGDEEEDEDEKSAKKTRKPASRAAAKPASKSKPTSRAKPASRKAKKEEDDEEEGEGRGGDGGEEGEDDKNGDADDEKAKGTHSKAAVTSDELAEIDGLKPKVVMVDGDEKEVSSLTSNSVYKVKRTWDHYYCTCPAWRNQGGHPVNARTCKHLKSLLGEKYEAARIKLKNPDAAPAATKKAPAKAGKSAPKGKGKRKKDDDDEEEDEEEVKPAKKKPARRTKKNEDEDEDEEDEEEEEEEGNGNVKVKGGKAVVNVLLANKWDLEKGCDPTGWWVSEKLDGVRTFYDGKQMYSRLGNPFTPPKWFLDKLPKDVTLDGELFGGRGKFQDTVSIVKTVNSPHWKNITFEIFDIPSRASEPFEDRIAFLKKTFGKGGTHEAEQIHVVEHEKAKGREHVLEKLKEIEGLGGEGLMLRKAGSVYEDKRSSTLLKIKTFYDGEAVVTGYAPGKGRNVGVTGALKCKMESGKTFNVGTGLSDKQRKNPPKIGSIITYRFQELTRDGVPRFPSYIGEAIDKDAPKDAEIPDHRKPGAKPADADV